MPELSPETHASLLEQMQNLRAQIEKQREKTWAARTALRTLTGPQLKMGQITLIDELDKEIKLVEKLQGVYLRLEKMSLVVEIETELRDLRQSRKTQEAHLEGNRHAALKSLLANVDIVLGRKKHSQGDS